MSDWWVMPVVSGILALLGAFLCCFYMVLALLFSVKVGIRLVAEITLPVLLAVGLVFLSFRQIEILVGGLA